jgi:hypothetical protein
MRYPNLDVVHGLHNTNRDIEIGRWKYDRYNNKRERDFYAGRYDRK